MNCAIDLREGIFLGDLRVPGGNKFRFRICVIRAVFLKEVQNVVQILLLANDLRLEDPPAYQLQPASPDELYREADSLALYLLQSLCWELVCIGEDLEVNCDGLEMSHGILMSHEQAQHEVAGMTRVSLGDESEDWTNGAYYAERAVAFVFVEDGTTSLWS